MDLLRLTPQIETAKAVPTTSQTPSANKTKPLLIPELKTSRNKPDLLLKPKAQSLRDSLSERGEIKSEASSDIEDSGSMRSAKDEHKEFQSLFAKFARKVTRLEKAAHEYLNDGAPKRMKQEHKHYSYLFASTLGDFPKLAGDEALDRYVKKMRRFKQTTQNLVKTCDEELNRFAEQNYYRNDMLVPPLKTLRILQRAVKNAQANKRSSSEYEHDKSDIKFSKLSLFSHSRDYSTGTSPSPAQLTPEIISPSPILTPKLKVNEAKSKKQDGDDDTVVTLPALNEASEKQKKKKQSNKLKEMEIKIEPPKEEENKHEEMKQEDEGVSFPSIQTSSVLAHSQSFVEDQAQTKRKKMLEEMKEQVLQKYLEALGLNAKSSSKALRNESEVNQIKSSFTPVNTAIKLSSDHKTQILAILAEFQSLISYREEGEILTLLSSSKHYLTSVTNKISKLVLLKSEKQYQFELSEEQALHLKALGERGTHFYDSIFQSLKVSQVVQDPSTRNYFVIYKCQPEEKKARERRILDSLSRLKKVCLKVSHNFLYLLKLPDMNNPDISSLNKFEHLHRTAMVARDTIPSQDFEMFPDFDPASNKKSETKEDEVMRFKTEDQECEKYSYFYALSGSLKDSSGFLKELRSQLEYWERYKLAIKENIRANECSIKWDILDQAVGLRWRKTESGRALEERYSVLLYYEPKRYLGIYGNFNQQKIVHAIMSEMLQVTKESHKELIQITQKSFTILQGAPRKEIEARLCQNFPEVKLYFHQSPDNRFWATITLKDGKNAQIARDVFKKLELDMMGTVEYVVLGSEYWSERHRLQEFILGNELQLHMEQNETAFEKEVLVSKASGEALWMRSHIGPREEKEFEFYSGEMSKKIDFKFRLLQFFFKLEESTYSIVPGREDTWSEVSPVNQYKLKRIALQRGTLPERREYLKSREQLIMGRKEEMEALRSILQSLKHTPDSMQGASIFIKVPISMQLILYLENKYKVVVSPYFGTNTLLIEGLLQQEALAELKRYWGFVGQYPRSLKAVGLERDFVLELFRSRWVGTEKLQDIEVVKISSVQKWHNYTIEKTAFEKLSPKKEIEQAVFQEEEDEEQYAKKLFSFNLRAKSGDLGRRKSVVLFHILIGKKLKSKEVREMNLPPTKASVERKKQHHNQSFDMNASFDTGVEEAKKGGVFYDTVEFKTEEGSMFRVFNRNHIYPNYKITYSVEQ